MGCGQNSQGHLSRNQEVEGQQWEKEIFMFRCLLMCLEV